MATTDLAKHWVIPLSFDTPEPASDLQKLWRIPIGFEDASVAIQDATPPTIDVTPAPGTISPTQILTIEIEDAIGISAAFVTAIVDEGTADERAELVFDSERFPQYSEAYDPAGDFLIVPGPPEIWTIDVRRGASWDRPTFKLRVTVVDSFGNAAEFEGVYNVDPAPIVPVPDTTNPVISNIVPVDRRLTAFEFVQLDVTDDSGNFARVLVGARYPDGITEFVHDGASFDGPYAASSTRVPIANGWRYTVLRTGGWAKRGVPHFRVFAIDAAGNMDSPV